MIDHAYAFDGSNWDFPDSPLQGLYPRRIVYDAGRSLDDFQPWLGLVLDLVLRFPEEVFDRAWKRIPTDWIEGDEDHLDGLLARLYDCPCRVPGLIQACRASRVIPFLNWT